MKLNIDPIALKQKPTSSIEVGAVVKRLKHPSKITDAPDIKTITDAICEGRTITAGELTGASAEFWKSQQLFIFDFDNEAKTIPRVTPTEVSSLFSKHDIPPVFGYWTFSNTPQHEKFRVAILCEEPITDADESKKITLGVMSLFQTVKEPNPKNPKQLITAAQIDLSCTNLDRIFYGTNQGLIPEMDGTTAFKKSAALSLYQEPIEQKELTLHTLPLHPPEPGTLDLKAAYEEYDLLGYILSTTNSRTARQRGDETLLNPCPICSHKDDFWVNTKKNTFKCHSASNGTGGNILNYLMEVHSIDRKTAREMFKYDLLGIDKEKEREKWKEKKRLETRKRKSPSVLGADRAVVKSALGNDTLPANNIIFLPQIKGFIAINPFETPENKRRYRWNDKGMGYLFADCFKNICRYVPETKSWFVYDGRVWRQDIKRMVEEHAKFLTEYMLDCRRYIEDEETRQDWNRFALGRMKKSARDVMISDATSVYPISILEFDTNPYMFNCQNGTLNLSDMTFNKHSPDNFLSKISNVNYDPTATCERWERFIFEIMRGDMETAKFLQKALGYTLTGDTREDCFFILYGSTTRNGKGTTMETTLHILGDYGKTAQPETIAQKQNSGGGSPSEDIARLKGARFVNISEPDKGLRLNSALVKQLTGGDTVTVRFLHQNSFEYRPEYKLFINTNYKPRTSDDTIFASERLHLIPFERHFKPEEQEKGLKELLKQPENMSGIFNFFLEGFKTWMKEGMIPPKAVKDATSQYREESDIIGQFIDDCLIAVADVNTSLKEIHTEYEKWCGENGYNPMQSRNLAKELRRKGLSVEKRAGYGATIIGFAKVSHEEIPLEWGK